MIDISTFNAKVNTDPEKLPLLTLEEFFKDNSEEDSIAPNQWGEGRPSINDIYECLKKLEQMEAVAWVRVSLHDDTEVSESEEGEVLSLYGESVYLATSFSQEEIEDIVDCDYLCSDGLVETDSEEIEEYYSLIPSVPQNYSCFEIIWD